MNYFITGIGTNIGKTVVSAIFTEALNADYWKPVQTGSEEGRDTDTVAALVSPLAGRRFFAETYCLPFPASPHDAAERAGISIDLQAFVLPTTENNLVIEGAGGLLVPLNDRDLLIDLIEKMQVPVVLVVQNYLGSINHTLLSVEALQRRGIPIAGLVFNGAENLVSEAFILNYTKLPCLLKIPQEPQLSPEKIQAYAAVVRNLLK